MARKTGPIRIPPMPDTGVPRGSEGRSYEGLDGASGVDVFYRPQRFTRQDLGSVDVDLIVRPAEGVELRCHPVEVSQTGMAFDSADEPAFRLGQVLSGTCLSFDGHVAYEGRIQVRSLRNLDGRAKVGVSFMDYLLNIDDVLRLRDAKKQQQDSFHALAYSVQAWSVSGHHEFKARVAELALFLQAAKDGFGRLEQTMSWEEIHGDEENLARQELIARIDEGFVPSYVGRSAEIDRLYRIVDPASNEALKTFSRCLIHNLILGAPVVRRVYEKPLGYAGDFIVMMYIYRKRFEGRTLYDKAVHRASVALHGGEAVRQRKDLLAGRIRDVIERCGTRRPARIVSVASGPAQEVYELLLEYPADGPEVEITLFDQDNRALELANTRLANTVIRRNLKNFRVVCIHDSIKSLFKGTAVLGSRSPFDLIYTAGLMDYLNQGLGRKLCQWFFDHLGPGGTCLVGNFSPFNPSRWTMEHLYEWDLIHRSPEELVDLASGLPGEPSVDVEQEPTGVNLFLSIRKP